ncbi:MAG: putative zinc-binding metallopeptidase [Deltaproteobacteria bacterium]|nr:putative zinc-binding metallopeptidase [Deltaproteobacteria bacterium]
MKARIRALLHWLAVTRGPVPVHEHHLAGTPARHPAIAEVLAEVAAFGIRPNVQFVWSIEGSGVEEDVPHVIHLHRTMLLADRIPRRVVEMSERYSALTLRATIRHEVGHSLLFSSPRVTRTPRFRRLFGDVRVAYRVGTVVDEVGRRIRRGGLENPRYRRVVSLYAASHPHEQFAEAVRIALATRGDRDEIERWATCHDAGKHAVAQIEFAASWLATYG